MNMLHVHDACLCCMAAACLYCRFMLNVHVAYPRCVSLHLVRAICTLSIHAACLCHVFHASRPWCMSLLLVHVACPCCLPILLVYAPAHLYCLSMLHVHASCSLSMLLVHAKSPCCISLRCDNVACPYFVSMLHVHDAYPCCMNILHDHGECTGS
jgi:hypothetical protein